MTKQKRLLILGGTGESAELAARAAEIPNIEVIASLAGRTSEPVVISENTRIGGFGGVAGLTNYLREQRIDLLIDATHPFAAQISENAAIASTAVNIPRVMLIRPAWSKTEADQWIEVKSNEAAAEMLSGLAKRVFLTIGRQELSVFAHLKDIWFLMRMIDPPQPNTPIPQGKLLLERGPFSLVEERSLLRQYKIEAIVSKNSGGSATYPKIIAAREIGIPVVMVQRPPQPKGEQFPDVQSVLEWLHGHIMIY